MYYWLPWEQKHNGKGTQRPKLEMRKIYITCHCVYVCAFEFYIYNDKINLNCRPCCLV